MQDVPPPAPQAAYKRILLKLSGEVLAGEHEVIDRETTLQIARQVAEIHQLPHAIGMEAATVIGLRTAKIAMGGQAAQKEAALMVDEKIAAAQALQLMAFTGGLGATPQGAAAKSIAHLRRKVRANRKRLSGG